jgi:hypothetical protein
MYCDVLRSWKAQNRNVVVIVSGGRRCFVNLDARHLPVLKVWTQHREPSQHYNITTVGKSASKIDMPLMLLHITGLYPNYHRAAHLQVPASQLITVSQAYQHLISTVASV